MTWQMILILAVAIIAILTGATLMTLWFVKLPKETQIENIKEWLKWAVVESEKALGAGTGQLKLRLVYDMAVNKFPWVVTLVSFSTFSEWVDDALKWMEKQLNDNKNAQNYVNPQVEEITE